MEETKWCWFKRPGPGRNWELGIWKKRYRGENKTQDAKDKEQGVHQLKTKNHLLHELL